MLNHDDHMESDGRPAIGLLLRRLAADGRAWVEAEVALAQVEIAELKTVLARAALLAGVALAMLVCSLFALMQGLISLLQPLLQVPGAAAFVLCMAFAVAAGLCLRFLRGAMTWRTESIFFRWLGGR